MKTTNEQLQESREILYQFFPAGLIPEDKNVMEVLELLCDHPEPFHAEQAQRLQQLCLNWCDSINEVSDQFSTPYEVYRYYFKHFLNDPLDSFTVVLLQADGQLICDERIAYGSPPLSIHPKQVFGPAVQQRAQSVICLDYSPWRVGLDRTEEDEQLIATLYESGETLKIPLLDYLILNREDYSSVFDPFTRYNTSDSDRNELSQIVKQWGQNAQKNRKKAKWSQNCHSPEPDNPYQPHS